MSKWYKILASKLVIVKLMRVWILPHAHAIILLIYSDGAYSAQKERSSSFSTSALIRSRPLSEHLCSLAISDVSREGFFH